MNPEDCARLMARPGAYVRVWFESSCGAGTRLGDGEIEEIVAEFLQPGNGASGAALFPGYPEERAGGLREVHFFPWSRSSAPTIRASPSSIFQGLENHIPGLEAVMMLDAGHFVTRERPKEMTQALMFFFNSMLAPGGPLFDLSREHGLPVRPVKPRAAWGVNSFDPRKVKGGAARRGGRAKIQVAPARCSHHGSSTGSHDMIYEIRTYDCIPGGVGGAHRRDRREVRASGRDIRRWRVSGTPTSAPCIRWCTSGPTKVSTTGCESGERRRRT